MTWFDVFNSIQLNEPIVLKRPLIILEFFQRSFKIFIRVEDKQQKRKFTKLYNRVARKYYLCTNVV